MREILWSEAPYPCVGLFKFLTIRLPSHPQYRKILNIMTAPPPKGSFSPPLLLDLACCCAQELRHLIHTTRIPATSLYGTDISSHYLSTSYKLFQDVSSPMTLMAGDILSPNPYPSWTQKFTVIHASLFLHLFPWEEQVIICMQVINLLKREKGALFLGEMVGCQGGGVRGGKANWLHDEGSFRMLWREVARKTGTGGRWKVKGSLQVWPDEFASKGEGYFIGEGVGKFVFSVERTIGNF